MVGKVLGRAARADRSRKGGKFASLQGSISRTWAGSSAIASRSRKIFSSGSKRGPGAGRSLSALDARGFFRDCEGSGSTPDLRLLTTLFFDSSSRRRARQTSQIQPGFHSGDRVGCYVYEFGFRITGRVLRRCITWVASNSLALDADGSVHVHAAVDG